MPDRVAMTERRLADRLLDLAVEAERLERLKRLEERFPELVRQAYRRGYLAGRASQRRGAPVAPSPEQTARGWVRKVCSK